MLPAHEYDEVEFCRVMRYSERIDEMEKRKEKEEIKQYIKDASIGFIVLVIYFNLLYYSF